MTAKRMAIGSCACLAVLLAAPIPAANIYKYQDENGIWHFTDRAPEDDIQFETVYMEREPEPRLRLRQDGPRENPVYSVFNDYWGPVEIELKLLSPVNVLSEPPLPARFVVPGQTDQVLVGIGALDPHRGFQYKLQMASVPGPPTPAPVTDTVLLPPFPADQEFPISQGFNGERTHTSPDSEYAVDIVMPIGTPVLAARDGVVMDVEEDFNRGGADRDRFVDKANHVRILHEDGTMALYAHLDLASVNVRRGARVRAGQQIARSGNTGFSSGPHLHFAIQQNVGMELISVPFQFRTAEGATLTPMQSQILRGAVNPR